MKKIGKLVLSIMAVVLLAGCVGKTDNADTTKESHVIMAVETNESVEHTQNNTKTYIQKADGEEFIPYITIDEKDKTFLFSYDVLSSYLAAGTYTESQGQLELKTDDGKYRYIFDIVDENTLKFNQKNSSDIHKIMGEEIKDGAEFVIAPLSKNITSTNELEVLGRLYIDFPQTANYQEAISFIQESELPYSEKKENGNRRIKIALKEFDTEIETPAVNTFKDYDYIEVNYMYPKQENDRHDDLDKYFFAGIFYVSAEGKYQLESHAENTFITMDGEVIDSQMNRQEQMDFLENHRGQP
ncbi:hypothetical protein AALB16_12800 [Lachnospiraceae bacterium 62-35]